MISFRTINLTMDFHYFRKYKYLSDIGNKRALCNSHSTIGGFLLLAKVLVTLIIALNQLSCKTSKPASDPLADNLAASNNQYDYFNQNQQQYSQQYNSNDQQSYQDNYTQQQNQSYQQNNYNQNQQYQSNYQSDQNSQSNLEFDAQNTAPVTNQSQYYQQNNYASNQSVNIDSQQYQQLDQQIIESYDISNQIVSKDQIGPDPVEKQQYSVTDTDLQTAMEEIQNIDMVKFISRLIWVGYDYRIQDNVVRIEIVTDGKPDFSIYRFSSFNGLPQILVRLHKTLLRRKISRDIDASEFSSPVSYIRMFHNAVIGHTDVVITLRELINAKLFAVEGNLLLSFKIPVEYYGNNQVFHAHGTYALNMLEDSSSEHSEMIDFDQGVFSFEHTPITVQPKDMSKGAFKSLPEDSGVDVVFSDKKENTLILHSSQIDTNLPPIELNNLSNPSNSLDQNQNYLKSLPSSASDNPDQTQIQFDKTTDQYASFGFELIKSVISSDVAQNSAQGEYQNYNYNQDSSSQYDNYQTTGSQQQYTQYQQQQNNDLSEYFDQQPKVAPPVDNNLNPPYNQLNVEDVNSDQENQVSSDYQSIDGYSSQEEADYADSDVNIHPVSLKFRDARLSDVIDILGEENGINFIYDYGSLSSKKLTINLNEVSWTHALEAVLNLKELGYRKLPGNVIKIENAADVQRTIISRPKKMLIMRLSYIEASEAKTILESFTGGSGGGGDTEGGGSGGGSEASGNKPKMEVDERTNSLIVEAYSEDLSKIKALVEKLDTQTPQVKIDAKIVEVSGAKSNSYGIDWNVNLDSGKLFSGVLPVNLGSRFAVQTPIDGGTTDLKLNLNSFLNVQEIMMQLNWQERHLNTRILQNTSVIVLDNKTASIASGTIDTIVLRGGIGGQDATQDIAYLLELNVTPQVTSDGSISMNVSLESSDPVNDAGQNRQATKTVDTHLIRESGETAAIGGIYTTTHSNVFQSVPYLHKIPIIGMMFRNKGSTFDKREIIILITPTIINTDKIVNASGRSVVGLDGNQDSNYNYQDNYPSDYENNYGNNTDNSYENNQANNNNNNNNNNNTNNYQNYQSNNYQQNQNYQDNQYSQQQDDYSQQYSNNQYNNQDQNYGNQQYSQDYDNEQNYNY